MLKHALKIALQTALTMVAIKMTKGIIDLVEGVDYHTVRDGKRLEFFGKRRKGRSNYDPYKHVVNKPKQVAPKIYIRNWAWIVAGIGLSMLYSCTFDGTRAAHDKQVKDLQHKVFVSEIDRNTLQCMIEYNLQNVKPWDWPWDKCNQIDRKNKTIK
jgi:hypothetical protein